MPFAVDGRTHQIRTEEHAVVDDGVESRDELKRRYREPLPDGDVCGSDSVPFIGCRQQPHFLTVQFDARAGTDSPRAHFLIRTERRHFHTDLSHAHVRRFFDDLRHLHDAVVPRMGIADITVGHLQMRGTTE